MKEKEIVVRAGDNVKLDYVADVKVGASIRKILMETKIELVSVEDGQITLRLHCESKQLP